MPPKIFQKVSPDIVMLFSQPVCVHRRETSHPVPVKVFLKVSPDMDMYFFLSPFVPRRRNYPAKVFLKVSPDMAMHFLSIGGEKQHTH